MKYIIYGAPGSGSGIVEAACAEIGVEYEARDLDARNDEHRADGYAGLNPHRKMPTLQTVDGEVITESVAILLTLDERHPEAKLFPPPGSRDRAQALRWMLFMATELYPLVEMVDYPRRFAASEAGAEAVRARAEQMQRERWHIVEAHVEASPFCVASGFSGTDIYLTKLSVWLPSDWRREHLPNVESITAKVLARPSLSAVWARHIRM